MKILLTLCVLFFSSYASANPLKDIVVFGDSLSDNGNLYEYMQHRLPQSPPYFEGRFTNGINWIERLTQSFFPENPKNHLQDYAFGGAGVSEEEGDDVLFTLRREIDSYLLTHEKADKNSLFVIWIGANNYLALPDDVYQAVETVNLGITHSLERLVKAGAEHILVLNLPDLGRTPAAKAFDAQETLSQLCQLHNERLATSIEEMKQKYPNVQWLFYDVNHFVDEMLVSPEQHGFNNIQDTCYDVLIDKPSQKSMLGIASRIRYKQTVDTCDGYLFFDPVHPSAPAHQIMADIAHKLLLDAGVTFTE